MSNELWVQHTTGQTVYALIFSQADDKIYKPGSGLIAVPSPWTGEDVDDYDVALTEIASGYYTADFPTALTTSGVYRVVYYQETGGDKTYDDTIIEARKICWNGSAERPYCSGPGAYAVTVTLRDTDGVPIPSAYVWVNNTNDISGSVVNPQYTGASGQVTFYLNYGTYYVFATLANYSFTLSGTANQIVVVSGTTSFVLDIGTDTSGSGSGSYLDDSFLSRAIDEVREGIDEPAINAKYTDARLIHQIEKCYSEVVSELNRLRSEPVVARFTITHSSSTSTVKYALPHTIGSIMAIYQTFDNSVAKVFYDSRGRLNTTGRGVWREGDALHVEPNILTDGDTLVIEYVPSGLARLINGTCSVDSTGLIVTLPSSPTNGTLDTHVQAYAGSVLRILRDTDSSYDIMQERTIVSYDCTTRQATLDIALSPNPNGSTGTTYFEIAPFINKGLDEAVGLYLAARIAAIEGDGGRAKLIRSMYQDSLRNLRLQAYYSNLVEARKMRADSYDNRRVRHRS